MFENKTPSPGSKNSDPLKELLKNQTTLHGKDEFYDPFATEWDDEYSKEPFFKPNINASQTAPENGGAANSISRHEEALADLDMDKLTLAGGLANMDMASMTLAGALPNINLSNFTLAGYLKKYGSSIPAVSESGKSLTTPEPEKPITTHLVKSGDTVASVAKEYGVSEEAIKAANPNQAMRFEKTDKSGYIWSFREVGVPIVIPSKEVAPIVEGIAGGTAAAPVAATPETTGEVVENVTVSELTKEEAEAGNSIISASVGKPNDASENQKVHTENINHTADLRLMQDRLLELGLLTQIAYDKEYNAMVVDIPARLNNKGLEPSTNEASVGTTEVIRKQVFPEQIPMTIEAIKTFQREVQRSGTIDGRVDPGGDTIKAFMDTSLTAEVIKAKRDQYIRDLAEAEKQRIAEEAREKAEEDRICALKNEPATEENAQRIIKEQGNISFLGDFLSNYIILNPALVLKVLDQLGPTVGSYSRKKSLALYMIKSVDEMVFRQSDIELLQGLHFALTGGILNVLSEEEQDVAQQFAKLVEGGGFKTVLPIISKDDWRSQMKNADVSVRDNEPGGASCKYVSEKMIYRHLYSDELADDFKRSDVINDSSGKFQYIVGGTGAGHFLSLQKEDKSKVKDITAGKHKQSSFQVQDTAELALAYLDSYLDQGIPVEVGVDHTFNKKLGKSGSTKDTKGYNEGTTDHFIVIIGKGFEKGRRFYQFFDPGTKRKEKATSTENKLYEIKDGLWQGRHAYIQNRTYTLTMVILFKKDIKDYSTQVRENNEAIRTLNKDYLNKTGDFKSE